MREGSLWFQLWDFHVSFQQRANSPALHSMEEKLLATQRELDRIVGEREELEREAKDREEELKKSNEELQQEYDMQKEQV